MIPKILHQFWASDNAFKEIYFPYRVSWVQNNPDWTFVQWTLKNFPFADVPVQCGAVIASDDVHYVLKTDVARWCLTYLFGGVWADHDVECLKPMSRFLVEDFFCGLCRPPDGLGNSLFGISKGHQFAQDTAVAVAEKILSNIPDANNKIVEYGLHVQLERMKASEATKYPVEYFYPTNWTEVGQGKIFTNCTELFPNSFAVHHWTGVLPDGWTWETIHKGEDRFRFFPEQRPKP